MASDEVLERIETSIRDMQSGLVRMTKATHDALAGVASQLGIIQQTLEVLDSRVGVLDTRVGLLHDRMIVVEHQMSEAIGRLDRLAEEFVRHTHGGEAA